MATESATGAPPDILFTVSYGQLKYDVTLDFAISLLLACIVVVFFSYERLNRSTQVADDNDITTKLLPRFLTPRRDYSKAMFVYIASMILILFLVSLLGPKLLNFNDAGLPEAPSTLPLFTALILVGLLPNMPWLQELEIRVRKFAHERALIPKGAKEIAVRLASAPFDFTQYKTALTDRALRGVTEADFSTLPDSLEFRWAKVSCLLYKIRSISRDGVPDTVDQGLLQAARSELERLILRRRSLEESFAKYRQDPSIDTSALQEEISWLLRQVYTLIGCGTQLRMAVQLSNGLRSFGFDVADAARQRRSDALVVMCCIAPVVGFAIYYLAGHLGQLKLWTPSGVFPGRQFEPFQVAMENLMIYSVPLLFANQLRSARSEQWFGSDGMRPWGNYILVTAICALSGYVGELLWLILSQGLTVGKFQLALPWTLLSAASAFFYVWNLDTLELSERPYATRHVIYQALIFAVLGLVAQTLTNGIIEFNVGSQGATLDVVLLTTILALIIGALMSWYMLSCDTRLRQRMRFPNRPPRPAPVAHEHKPLDGVDW